MSSFSSYLFLDFDLLGACSGSMGTVDGVGASSLWGHSWVPESKRCLPPHRGWGVSSLSSQLCPQHPTDLSKVSTSSVSFSFSLD